MAASPPAHVEILPNGQNVQIGEMTNYIVNGNYISGDQATLIQLLQPILDASHTRDRETSPPNSACFPGTRIDVIRLIVAWADSTLLWNTHILWLYGYVGCGKSAIALAVALKFERRNRLVGSFFFFRNTGDRSRMRRFATTLAFQLAAAIPEAAPFIKRAVTEEGLLGSSLVAQLRRLVYEPFKAAAKKGRLLKTTVFKGPFLIVIDGLDECEDRQDVQAFIDDLVEFFRKNPLVPLRFFITSRVEQHIQSCLTNGRVRLENLVNHCSRHDIDTFMTACFENEKKRNPIIKAYIRNRGDWPAKKDKDELVDHIGGSFIFASALFKYIVDPTDDQSTPMDRLPHTLNMNPGLDTLYARTLARSQHLPHFLDVISTLAYLVEPLPIVGIAELLGIEPFEVVRILVNLQAIIHVPGTDDIPVTMCHTSLRDFLTAGSRSGCFFTPPSFHLYLVYRCSTLYDGRVPDTAAALYSAGNLANHIEQLALLPPAEQGPLLRFPQTLDAFYAHTLATSQHDPYFLDIISIVALHKPCPAAKIGELLEIESLEVVRVLSNLRAIFDIPETDDTPITFCHTSVHQFLTTESRSGRFFVPPSYHLKLSYYYFRLQLDHPFSFLTAPLPVTTQNALWSYQFDFHWQQFLGATPEQNIRVELEQLTELPSARARPYQQHLLAFTLPFFWGSYLPHHKPPHIIPIFTKAMESLALALEHDDAPYLWLQRELNELVVCLTLRVDTVVLVEVREEQVHLMQQYIQRIEAALRAKVLSILALMYTYLIWCSVMVGFQSTLGFRVLMPSA
ncbi:hypothetical protein MD484_g6996, partial [Candolleomyces efflorescens]